MTTEPRPGEIKQLGCLIASGADAAEFLQAQLSADLVSLEAGQLALAGWHNPQGRVRCVLWAGPLESGNWRLVTETNQLDPLATGLSRFILRSKARLAEEPEAGVMVAANHSVPHSPDSSQWALPGDAGQSICVVAPQNADGLDPQAAIAALVAAGVPRLDATLSEQFLGQSLNLDLLTAISFTKGCFPGQEVLARLHNLGRVKRRLLRFTGQGAPPQVGESIINGEGEQRGQVVCCSPQSEFLASVELRGQGQALFLTGSQTPLTELPLPYRVPELDDDQ